MLYLLTLLQMLSISCQHAPSTPTTKGPVPGTQSDSSRYFVFNAQQQNIGPKDAKNWCSGDFSEAIPLFPDPNNANRRFFYLDKGIYKLGISIANIGCRMMFKDLGNGAVQISTSDNFPTCLSNRASFLDTSEPNRIHYDNQRHVEFDILALPEGDKTKIAIDLDLKFDFGLAVYRCGNCN